VVDERRVGRRCKRGRFPAGYIASVSTSVETPDFCSRQAFRSSHMLAPGTSPSRTTSFSLTRTALDKYLLTKPILTVQPPSREPASGTHVSPVNPPLTSPSAPASRGRISKPYPKLDLLERYNAYEGYFRLIDKNKELRLCMFWPVKQASVRHLNWTPSSNKRLPETLLPLWSVRNG
jgi:hypothetical protein